jgi:hypothetical protein
VVVVGEGEDELAKSEIRSVVGVRHFRLELHLRVGGKLREGAM